LPGSAFDGPRPPSRTGLCTVLMTPFAHPPRRHEPGGKAQDKTDHLLIGRLSRSRDLDPLIVRVADVHRVPAVDERSRRGAQNSPVPVPAVPEGQQEFPLFVEELHVVEEGVDDVHGARPVHGDALGHREIPDSVPVPPEGGDETARGIERLDPEVQRGRSRRSARRGHGKMCVGEIELAVAGAPPAEEEEGFPLLREGINTVGMRCPRR